MNDVPSPAIPPYVEVLTTPWLATLDRLYRQKCAETEQLTDEIIRLKVTVETLQRRLREARNRQELWEARQQAWRRERAELLHP